MNVHILGICGTFMGGVAALARAAGHQVTGSDTNVYPPMSTQLESLGIKLHEGYDPSALDPAPDLVIIGNALSRGNPAIEYVLDQGIPYTSGPRWLGENYRTTHRVLAVAGTHGKTTTASILAWMLEDAGLNPGFLIGGIAGNFGISARATASAGRSFASGKTAPGFSPALSGGDLFVIEADEYDTAFFDKRAKFVHYRPEVLVLNNLEFDHADIYPDIRAIQTQFHHLLRTIPGRGIILNNAADPRLNEVLEMGCWSRLEGFAPSGEQDAPWQVELLEPAGRKLAFIHDGGKVGEVEWLMSGRHNAMNALAAVAAAAATGVEPEKAVAALATFKGVKRRLELLTEHNDIRVYDDFAHHPTAIRLTLEGLRRSVGNGRILVALEPASNTMRAGHHTADLGPALAAADYVWLKTGEDTDWDPQEVLAGTGGEGRVHVRTSNLLAGMLETVRPGDCVVFMSNRSFDGAPRRFVEALTDR